MADKSSENGDEQFNISTKIQLSGVLLKRPFGHHSSKWSKRFFIVKEGFLLYYPENERKVFEKRGYFNIHPKGVIPLGGCSVEPVHDMGQQYAFHIKSDEFNSGYVALAADNHYEREKWVAVMQEASRITWRNTQLGETLIQELEIQGLQLCRERQNYFDRLQEETVALRNEIDKNEELEKVTTALDDEKKKLEQMILELKEELEGIKQDYDTTLLAAQTIQDDKALLQKTTMELQQSLQDLANEREQTISTLKSQEEKNCKLNATHIELQNNLKAIETETRLLMMEKQELEQRFVENEMHSKVLADEKKFISEHALKLQASLQDLLVQKVLTESELKEEILARINAEKKLKSAEDSVHHLELVIHGGVGHISEGIRDELLPDVKKLKKFFEDVAEEAKIDANKPIIMKNSILARKKKAQLAREQLFQTTRTEKAKSLGIQLESMDINNRSSNLRRSFSTIVMDRAKLNTQLTLKRCLSTKNTLRKKTNGSVTESEPDDTLHTCIVDNCAVQIRRKLSVVGEDT